MTLETLYPCLNTKKIWNLLYESHMTLGNPLYNNDCIYTPNVCVFKSDIDFPVRIKKERLVACKYNYWRSPNLRDDPSNQMNPYALKESAKVEPSLLEGLLK